MMKKEKADKFGKSVFWAVISYVVLSIVAGVCSVVRERTQGNGSAVVSWFSVLELFLFPVLFFAAGYFGSKVYRFEKFKTWKVWLFSAGFSAVIMLLWYIVLEGYVMLNLPAAEGSIALDFFLRKIIVVKDYTVLYLRETDGYRYVLLPFIHFVFRLLYWLLYALGNRKYAMNQKERERAAKLR